MAKGGNPICGVRPSYWQMCGGLWSMCVALLCCALPPWPSCWEFGDDSDTKAGLIQALTALTRSWCPLPHCTGGKKAKTSPTWFLTTHTSDAHTCLNHPAAFSQLSDDALSPSYLTQVTGSTFDKCKHIVFISEDLLSVFMRICGCC